MSKHSKPLGFALFIVGFAFMFGLAFVMPATAKLIAGQWEDPASTRRGPRRRIYRLTPKGRRRFSTAAAEFQQFVNVLSKIVGPAT